MHHRSLHKCGVFETRKITGECKINSNAGGLFFLLFPDFTVIAQHGFLFQMYERVYNSWWKDSLMKEFTDGQLVEGHNIEVTLHKAVKFYIVKKKCNIFIG